jgi:hypothetical protein
MELEGTFPYAKENSSGRRDMCHAAVFRKVSRIKGSLTKSVLLEEKSCFFFNRCSYSVWTVIGPRQSIVV